MKVYEITMGNTHVFYGYITENDIDISSEELSLYRRKKIENLKGTENKKLSVLSEKLLLYGMDKLGIKYNLPLEFILNEHGKPSIKGKNNLFFNLSHSREMAVCAISDNIVGVDNEKITRDCSSVADKYYTDGEKVVSKNKGTSYIWTRKEAVAKANGRGIGMGIDKVDTSEDVVTVDGIRYRIFTNSVDEYYISCACRLEFP